MKTNHENICKGPDHSTSENVKKIPFYKILELICFCFKDRQQSIRAVFVFR